jgi:hypothetical protein
LIDVGGIRITEKLASATYGDRAVPVAHDGHTHASCYEYSAGFNPMIMAGYQELSAGDQLQFQSDIVQSSLILH